MSSEDERSWLSSASKSPRRVINPAAHSKYLSTPKTIGPEHVLSHQMKRAIPPDASSTSSKSQNINTSSTISSSHSPRREIFPRIRTQGKHNRQAGASTTSSISTDKGDNENVIAINATRSAPLSPQCNRPIHSTKEDFPPMYIEKRQPMPQSTVSVPKSVSLIDTTTLNKDSQPVPSLTLEKRLFHEIHKREIRTPSIKEFKECWSFANAVKSFFGKNSFDIVIDVAGGHGALAALFLILTSAKHAVVVDPAVVGQTNGVQQAWGTYYQGKNLRFRHECLRTALPAELDELLHGGETGKKFRVLVVACHACQHLSDETLEIACSYGVHVAVMPCCQKDLFGGSFKAFSKQVKIGIGPLIDVLTAGKVMSWTTGAQSHMKYEVKLRTIDKKITPQNRLILCKARHQKDGLAEKALNLAHEKLERAYLKAHSNSRHHKEYDARSKSRHHKEYDARSNSSHRKEYVVLITRWIKESLKTKVCTQSMTLGVFIGIVGSLIFKQRARIRP